MSADADDLFERADRAMERDVETLDELKRDLEGALDELERRFPRGCPPRGDNWERLQYRTLVIRIKASRTAIEHGLYSEDEPDADWQQFLESHPELSGVGAAVPENVDRPSLTFTDAELLRSLRSAGKAWDRRMPAERRGAGIYASLVADELADVTYVRGEGRVPKERVPTTGDVIRVGQALARLAREGRVERTNRKWESNRWAPTKRKSRDDA